LRKFDSFQKSLIIFILIIEIFFHIQHFRITKQLLQFRSFLLVMSHQFRNKNWQLFTIRQANFLILPNHNLFEQLIRCVCSKRWPQHSHFIEHTSQRPNVTLEIIRLFIPNLRRSIVRRSSLCDCKLIHQMLRNIKISQFRNTFMEKYICRFNISVDYICLVKFIQSF